MMKLKEQKTEDFVVLLASAEPAPGGGSTAALEGSLAAALIHMVASLTEGKKKYAEHQDFITGLLEESEAVYHDFLELVDRDTEVFNYMRTVFAMPGDTEEERLARRRAREEALKLCTQTPREMMALGLKALELAAAAMGKTNANAASDLGVAVISLKAAVQGAWLNILINIAGIDDRAFTGTLREEGQKILARALPLADNMYQKIAEALEA
ncbi:MAG: cyclodeaminase/cyclohydrolase family protein [Spirochaetaceae bacterium]|jgi:formiminotetrahydrofolate cyclodeaminase|nr:cyclodeaminase/cyclohydrolase family protein [Spirochaetaceae bacterium]